jgi:hypothetical protein
MSFNLSKYQTCNGSNPTTELPVLTNAMRIIELPPLTPSIMRQGVN